VESCINNASDADVAKIRVSIWWLRGPGIAHVEAIPHVDVVALQVSSAASAIVSPELNLISTALGETADCNALPMIACRMSHELVETDLSRETTDSTSAEEQ